MAAARNRCWKKSHTPPHLFFSLVVGFLFSSGFGIFFISFLYSLPWPVNRPTKAEMRSKAHTREMASRSKSQWENNLSANDFLPFCALCAVFFMSFRLPKCECARRSYFSALSIRRTTCGCVSSWTLLHSRLRSHRHGIFWAEEFSSRFCFFFDFLP